MAAGDRARAFDVLDGLGQLVDKSLVVADETDHGTRYRLLETIRQYALERLEDGGRDRRGAPAPWNGSPRSWRELPTDGADRTNSSGSSAVNIELENLRAALTWAVGSGELELAVAAIASFDSFLMYSSTFGYAHRTVGRDRARPEGAEAHPRGARC